MTLICFEGSDYSGKTSTAKLLVDRLPNTIYNSGSIYDVNEKQFFSALKNNTITELQREALYTMSFFLDKQKRPITDDRLIFQDRYWMSVVAYGRFLNCELSLHHNTDLSSFFIIPDAIILLSCNVKEKIQRHLLRGNHSVLDDYFIKNNGVLERLNFEIEESLPKIPNILHIDNSNIPLIDVADIIEEYLRKMCLL